MLRSLCWLLVVGWAGVIFWLSASGDARGAFDWLDLSYPGDKLVHAGAFGFLALLLYGATGRAWLSVLLASFYGAGDELHQATVPGRTADLWDWVADTVGAALAVGLVVFLTRGRRRRAKTLQ